VGGRGERRGMECSASTSRSGDTQDSWGRGGMQATERLPCMHNHVANAKQAGYAHGSELHSQRQL
jgi:hypothetical protein